MANICLGNLLPNSVLAYSNLDLIPSGFIPQNGTAARPRTRNQGGQIISERETLRLLPADRIYVEFWYGVSSRITGTNFGDLGQGAFQTLGLLGGGAGASVGGFIACQLSGDSEKTSSRWVFHVCESETRINREFILTESNINSQTITLPDYVMGVLGVTKNPIEFVTPNTPLTEEQILRAKSFTSDEVESRLGRRVSPEQLTESDMRILLGLSEINELENLGNSGGRTLGWPQSSDGQIQAEFKKYKYSDKENIFTGIIRDDRKNLYRADNEIDRANGHCFWNGSVDDLTDKVIGFKIQEVAENGQPPSEKLKVGDKIYISYVAVIKTLFRHATENITNFFLFPDQSAYQMPPLDLVRGWNFKKYKFKVHKNKEQRSTLNDIKSDEKTAKDILAIQSNIDLSDEEKSKKVSDLQQNILLVELEGQRLIETKLEKADRNIFIKGGYFADSRGILSINFRDGGEPEILIPYSDIRDKSWFDNFLLTLKYQNGNSFDENGRFLTSAADEVFFDDFLFDISDAVNSVLYDNEKYGYERRLAKALTDCSVYNKDIPGTGVGGSNLDFIRNKTPGRENYDLSSAKFDSIPMQGSSSVSSCNVSFVYDNGFCSKGTIRADMILRTPIFLEKLNQKARIYVEKFQAQNPLRGDSGIWVGTTPSFGDSYSVTTDPRDYYAYLVYSDVANNTVNFRVFENGILENEYQNLKLNTENKEFNTLNNIDNSLTEENVKYAGYDRILGDQPGYFKGTEITVENALILLNKVSPSIIQNTKLEYSIDDNSGRINISGISGRRLRKIVIKYYPKSKDFLNDSKRLISLIFPNSKTIIDNIALPYEGLYNSNIRTLTIDVRYINFDNFFIDGVILKNIKIVSIFSESISEESYQKYRISTNKVSTCFDSYGNWLVFYEDERASEGDLVYDGRKADGSHLIGPNVEGSLPGLQDKSDKEISCLFSPDEGFTWYDFKGIIRTITGDVVGSPYGILDKITNTIHLFYVLNDNLMVKSIDSSLLKVEDAFLAYKRPLRLDEKVKQGYGLYHFSPSGIQLRETASFVVVGNILGDYLRTQLQTSFNIRKLNRTDFRILVSGDGKNYVDGFPEVDFLAYRDAGGTLKVMFISSGRFYCRGSYDNGVSWFDFIPEGMLIHKNSNIQELKSVKNIGIAVDYKSKVSYITYQSDGMLFVRKFDSESSFISDISIKDVLDPEKQISPPIFVIGTITPELKTAINNKETYIIFPYKSLDTFENSFAISESPALGYVTSSGFMRFFYKDANGNFRAFSYQDTPILDINYGKQ